MCWRDSLSDAEWWEQCGPPWPRSTRQYSREEIIADSEIVATIVYDSEKGTIEYIPVEKDKAIGRKD